MKNAKEPEFKVTYKNKVFIFSYGSEAYIFHTGVYNGVDEKYGMKALSEYVTLTQDCYLSDSNRTPLGALADYIAVNWKEKRKLNKYELLDMFYQTEDL